MALGSEWAKSTYSSPDGACVEARRTPEGGAEVRDTKDRGNGPIMRFTAEEWAAFVKGAKDGEFDI